jgi:hypothetical protein
LHRIMSIDPRWWHGANSSPPAPGDSRPGTDRPCGGGNTEGRPRVGERVAGRSESGNDPPTVPEGPHVAPGWPEGSRRPSRVAELERGIHVDLIFPRHRLDRLRLPLQRRGDIARLGVDRREPRGGASRRAPPADGIRSRSPGRRGGRGTSRCVRLARAQARLMPALTAPAEIRRLNLPVVIGRIDVGGKINVAVQVTGR